MKPPRPFSALPSVIYCEASPKAISRRTSYIPVRLEFLRYPQVIPDYFNRRGFGPPQRFTAASACSWIGHQVSGLRHATFRPLQTRFRFGSAALPLNLATQRNSPARSTKSTTSHACGALSACKHTVSVLFTFPSRYYSLSVTWSYLAFGDGPPVFRLDFSCPGVLRIPLPSARFRLRDFYPLRCGFPTVFDYLARWHSGVLTPHVLLHAVWAPPISLATTFGIVLTFFSSGYLDVSVPRVPLLQLWIHCKILQHYLQ